jgi:hypothetical protein
VPYWESSTVLLPIDLTFVDARGVAADVDASPLLPAILGSPVFQPAAFVATGDMTQYGDGTDAQFLGHEVTEWINDPFDDNRTPPWFFSVPPIAPAACGRSLEVGDLLELAQFSVVSGGTTYNLQDEAFLSWFARQSPSIGYAGRYSFLGTFGTYSQPC